MPRGKEKRYNGHRNRNYWNVSLWINNDQELYKMAVDCLTRHPTRKEAATEMFDILRGIDPNPQTPDGVKYTVARIISAMEGIWKDKKMGLNIAKLAEQRIYLEGRLRELNIPAPKEADSLLLHLKLQEAIEE